MIFYEFIHNTLQNYNIDKRGIMIRTDQGMLIDFEGIDGSGKTTQAEMAHAHLLHQGIPVRLLREPTHGRYGKTIRDILSGRLPRRTPEEELDLHGSTAELAREQVAHFLRGMRTRNKKCVRIIVGKGLHSPGRAVLPDIAEKEAASLKKEGIVRTFYWEKRRKMKSGSLIVILTSG